MRWAKTLRSCLLAVSLATATAAVAKVNFEDFTAAQQEWFWEKLEMYAKFDAFLRNCQRNSQFERRIQAVVAACATPEAIAKARAVYQRRVAFHMKTTKISSASCGGTFENFLREQLDSAVADVSNACSLCAFCKK